MTPRGRRWRRIFVGFCLTAVLLCVATPPLIRLIVRHRLQAMVSDKLNAHLDIGKLVYTYPYGVIVSDASLVTQTPGGESLTLLNLPRLDLQLAKLPFGRGPLVIQRLEITEPSVHLIRTADGLFGRKGIIRQNAPQAADSSAQRKLSDLFQLTHFAMHGGQVVYEDRTAANSLPVVWRDLNVDLNLKQSSGGDYAYHLIVDNEPLAKLEASGSANIDDLTLKIEKCALAVAVDPHTAESPLPAVLQHPLQSWDARGKMTIDLSADIPLRRPSGGVCHCVVALADASARVPGWRAPLDRLLLKMELDHASNGSSSTRIDILEADALGARVRIEDARAAIDPITGAWQCKLGNGHIVPPSDLSTLPSTVAEQIDQLHLTGSLDFALDASGPSIGRDLSQCTGTLALHPRNLTLRPPGFSQPIGGMIDTTLTLAHGAVLMQELRGTSGDHILFLKQAKIQLADLPARLHVSDAAGALTLGPSRAYPPVVARELGVMQPVGPYFFGGSVDVDLSHPRPAVDYHLMVHTSRGRIVLGSSRIPLTTIDTIIALSPAGANITKLNASLLGGSCNATGNVKFTAGTPYALKLNCRDLDLNLLAGYLAKPGDQPTHLSGLAILSANFAGVIPPGGAPPYQGLRGDGEFEIRHGDFWEIPVMKSIAGAFSKDSLIVGEAAGQFQIEDGKVHFNRAVANSPLLGVEGSGDVTFAGKLDFKGVADPFGSWGERVGDHGALATIAGTVQRTINIATSQVLYEIVVSGTTSNPKTSAVAAPIVTRGVKTLLSAARNQNLTGGLLDELHRQDNQ